MRRHRIGSVLLVLGATVTPAVVPAGVASATTHHPKHKKHHNASSTPTGSSATALGCADLGSETTKEQQLATELEQAMTAGNFAAVKADLISDFSQLNGAISAAQAHVSSAPSNVRAAFATEVSAFKALESDIQAATSLPQLASSFQSLGGTPQLEAAAKTLAAYYGTKCGTTTSTSIPA
jgi:hypothetical protein